MLKIPLLISISSLFIVIEDLFRLVVGYAEFFNEKFNINRYFYAESKYNNFFFDESIVQKLFNFKVIFPYSTPKKKSNFDFSYIFQCYST